MHCVETARSEAVSLTPISQTITLQPYFAANVLMFRMAEEFMAFGDSLNDLSMLTWAGEGVAMANAREDVKAQVRHACGTNQEDGVARYIESLLL